MVGLPQPYRSEQYPDHSWKYLVGGTHTRAHTSQVPVREGKEQAQARV